MVGDQRGVSCRKLVGEEHQQGRGAVDCLVHQQWWGTSEAFRARKLVGEEHQQGRGVESRLLFVLFTNNGGGPARRFVLRMLVGEEHQQGRGANKGGGVTEAGFHV